MAVRWRVGHGCLTIMWKFIHKTTCYLCGVFQFRTSHSSIVLVFQKNGSFKTDIVLHLCGGVSRLATQRTGVFALDRLSLPEQTQDIREIALGELIYACQREAAHHVPDDRMIHRTMEEN